MNKFIVISFFYFTVNAQSPTTPLGTQVTPVTAGFEAPAIVTSKFTTEFPNSNPTWSKLGDDYMAEILDGATQLKKIIVYDSFGNLLYTSSETASYSYPKSISNYLKKKYPDSVFQVWALQKKDSVTGYYSFLNKDTLWFDNAGRLNSQRQKKR